MTRRLALAVGLDVRCAHDGVGSTTSLGTSHGYRRRSHACGTATMVAAQAPRAAQGLGLVRRPLADTFRPAP